MQAIDKLKGDKNAKVKFFVALPLFIIWFIFFIFIIVANVGNKEVHMKDALDLPGDYQTYFNQENELDYPTWTFVVSDPLPTPPVCKRCSFLASGDPCANSPSIPTRDVNNDKKEYQFNWNPESKSKAIWTDENFISCNVSRASTTNFTLVFVYSGTERPSSIVNNSPYGELLQDVQPGETRVIQYRKIVTFNDEDGFITEDFQTINTFLASNRDADTRVYMMYGSQTVEYHEQYPKPISLPLGLIGKGSFWSFIGELGGMSFVMLSLYYIIIFALTMCGIVSSDSTYDKM